MKHPRTEIFLVVCGLLATFPARAVEPRSPATIEFNRDIRPILSDKCFHCHGPDKNHRKAKLRLDDRDAAVEKSAFIPGQPDESELVKRIFTADPEDLMPPPDAHKPLTTTQKDLLRRWIAEGAKYAPHWAFIPPRRPALPRLTLKANGSNPIDAFVFASLQARGIQPSPEADRRTLLRRLSLDLTGLPPTPAEVAGFVTDKSPGAYQKQVKRLLASPHYGERMAVPWLDVVRFTDTVGYHGDQNANVFPYRDYVIDAFNQNKPFDQFTIEQIAGDLLPKSTVEQRVATGFNRLNMVTREGGAQPGEYLAKYGADRTRTVGMAWLGLTVGCAECHDHKFDPVTTRDFYALKAFFADVRQWGVYSDYKYTPNPELKGWSNEHPFPPEEVVDSSYLHRRIEKLRRQIAGLADATMKRADERQRAQFASWKSLSDATLKKHPDGWLTPRPVVMASTNASITTNKVKLTNVLVAADAATSSIPITNRVSYRTNVTVTTNFTVEADGSLRFDAKARDSAPIALQLTNGWLAAVRLEVLPHAQHGGSIFRGNNKSASVQLSASLKRAGEKKETKLAFYHADADFKEPRYSNGSEIIGIKDSWKLARDHARETQTGVWLLDPPVPVAEGDTLLVSLKTNVLGCVRVSTSPFAMENPLTQADAKKSKFKGALTWFASTAPDAGGFTEYKRLHRELMECRGGKSPTLVTVSWTPDLTRVLPRGNWQAENGEIVSPQPPHFLPPSKPAGTNRLTRLDLAQWLVSSDNPLTARVVVNRLWKQFLGNGLANPVDDLGSQGEPPSHPELLDWLAVEFRDSGWDMKHMVQLLVTSATYRQSSNLRPELRDLDPNNRLLASQNPRRLEAEFVRDNTLAIAGLLDLELGGPSAHPYQPAGYYENLQFPDRDYLASRDERQYRRGLYSHWQRTFLHPMLANFDAPAREECTANRNVSNTPQQALTLLNDPTFVEAARIFAQRLLQSPAKSDEARLERAYQEALARPIRANELASLKEFLAAQREHYQTDREEPARLQKTGLAPTAKELDPMELAAWTSLCRVILNLHETMTRY